MKDPILHVNKCCIECAQTDTQQHVVWLEKSETELIRLHLSPGWGGGGGGAGGGTLILSYIHRLGSFLGFNILNSNIFLFIFFWGGGVQIFRKINIFGGMKILGGNHKIGLYLGFISTPKESSNAYTFVLTFS